MISGDDADREWGDALLRASDRRIENILESITDEFFALDREWRYTYINERGLRHIQSVTGEELTREGLLGKNVWELFPEHVGSVFYQKYHEALREQKTVHFEAPSPVRETWFEAHVYPSEEGLAVYCRDITERKRAEETLQRAEREYHNLFELANDAILVYEPESRVILDVNDNACAMYGIPKEKLVGTAMRELSQDHQRARRYLEALLREGSYQGFETVHRRADGTLIEVVVNSSVIAFRGQRAILSINRDVTRSKRMEARLREAETRYRTLVEQVPAAIYIQQPGEPSTTTYISPQMEAMQGYTPREIVENPEHWTRTLHPDDRERVLAEDARTNETGEPFKMEYRQFANDGRVVWVRDEAALVRDEEGSPLYWQGVLLDVTERKLAEEQLLFQAHLLE